MRIKLSIATAAFLFFAVVPMVGAQETLEIVPDNSSATATPSPATARPVMQREISPIREVMITKDFRTQVTEKRDAAREAAKVRRDALRDKIDSMQDAQKKAVLQRLDTRFETINDTTTQKYSLALEQMSMMLDRVGSEAANFKSNGANTLALDAAITRARTAITTAENAVSTQAGKTYVMSVPTEMGARTAANTTVTQFRTDLRSTYLTVSAAKQAVRNAVTALITVQKAPIAPSPVASESANVGE
ncbi:MAG TPA: hypothetical protein PLD54_04275 [Candidatus Levybacteria bacterium]|nr:hypothetical protein [Candidatus Levybacteria bacterium]